MDSLISVIVPVYNVASYLEECLNSLCHQTYKQLEILLIDDGSTDGSDLICDQWKEKDDRIRVMRQSNSGVSAARNKGLRACRGEWIGFVDADDWCELDMFQSMYDYAAQQDAEAVICGYVDYPRGSDRPSEKGLFPQITCGYAEAVYPVLRRNGYFSSLWNKLFRRDAVFLKDGPVLLDASLSYGEDEVWLFEVLKNCRRIAFLPRALYHWRTRTDSLSRFEKLSERQMSLLRAKERSTALLPEDKRLARLKQGRDYNSCYKLKVAAYCAGDWENFAVIHDAIRPWKRAWLCSCDLKLPRKMKLLLMDAVMALRLPRGIVTRINRLHGI